MLLSVATRSNLLSFEKLLRLRLSVTVAASASAGYLMTGMPFDLASFLSLTWGVLLLSAGCSVLNQVQEREVDARMARTRERPVARGRLGRGAALLMACALGLCGLLLLYLTDEKTALLGATAAAWYHIVYTPLKKRTPWAIPLGAVCGALPPLMGWAAAGGFPGDPAIWNLSMVFVLWQVPHFWLLILPERSDYDNAGLCVLPFRWSSDLIFRMAKTWTLGLAALTALLPLLGLMGTPAGRWGVSGLGAWLMVAALGNPERLSLKLTRYICLLILFLALDALLARLS